MAVRRLLETGDLRLLEDGGIRLIEHGGAMSIITDLQAIEAALRQEALDITAQADAVTAAIVALQAIDNTLDAAATAIDPN